MSARIFGSAIRRREDPRLLTGLGTFTDDLSLPGMVHAAMLRSPHAHARIVSIDTAKAAKAPGVLAVYIGKDIAEALKPMPCAWLLPNADLKIAEYPIVARDTVRYVGDIVAVVVAATRLPGLRRAGSHRGEVPDRCRRWSIRRSRPRAAGRRSTRARRATRPSTGRWPAATPTPRLPLPAPSSSRTASSSSG